MGISFVELKQLLFDGSDLTCEIVNGGLNVGLDVVGCFVVFGFFGGALLLQVV